MAARADAADVRATEREGQAERYSVWEAEHRAERELAEAARAELARRNAAERQAAQASAPQEPEATEPEPELMDDSSIDEPKAAPEPEVIRPVNSDAEWFADRAKREAEADLGNNVPEVAEPEELEPVVKEVTADSIGDEFPQITTGAPAEEPRPIADPALARAAAELDAHQAARQADELERAAELADRQEEAATREASKAYEASQPSAGAESPGAWVAGPEHAVLRRAGGHYGRALPSGGGRGRAVTARRPVYGCQVRTRGAVFVSRYVLRRPASAVMPW